MRKKIQLISLTIFAFFCSNMSYSQIFWRGIETPKINNPKVDRFNNFEIADDNVNLSTGELTPKVSIINIQTNSLYDNISLIYVKGKGIKVNDISNCKLPRKQYGLKV